MLIKTLPATSEHISGIAILTNELGYKVDETKTEDWFNFMLNSELHCVFVALNSCYDVCGWVAIEKRVSLETGYKAEITGLIVSRSYRRLGIGQQLVSACEDWARQNNLVNIMVSSNIKRKASHIFYTDYGFSFIKTSQRYEKN